MKIYLAGERLSWDGYKEALWAKHAKRRLFSYFYHGLRPISQLQASGLTAEIEHARKLNQELFLDSGAFTAFTKKTSIDPVEYASYVERHEGVWETCSSLDAIGSGEEAAQASYNNLKCLENYGAVVQPVWHVREPNHWLQRYMDEGYDYIFIGGMVPETTRWLKVRLDEIWGTMLTKPDGTPKVKTHGFGLTDQQLMFRYPWYSVDSTSWLMTGVFGACLFRNGAKLTKVVFSEESPEARKWKGWHYSNLPPRTRNVVDEWIAPYNVTAEQLASHYSYRDVVNAAVFQTLEDLGATKFFAQQIPLFETMIAEPT